MDAADDQLHLFEHFTLDMTRRILRNRDGDVRLRAKSFDVLCCLVRRPGQIITKNEIIKAVWPNVIVSDESLARCVSDIRLALADREQRLIKTMSGRGYLLAAPVTRPPVDSRLANAAAAPEGGTRIETTLPATPAMRQEVRFCTTSDGVRIAHSAVGQGPPLVRATHWLGHLEYDWQGPLFGPFMRELAAGRRLVRYDGRGSGLSDWDGCEISFEGFVRDLECVVEASGLQRFALLGMSQGSAISIAYAARHPERVSQLIIYGGYARGRRKRAGAKDLEHIDAMTTLMREGWGQANPAFRQLWTSLFLPGGTPEQMNSFNELQRISTSAENAVCMRQAMDEIDVTALLPRIKAPTLVLHRRGDAVSPFEEGRQIAATIPDARFVALEGDNHCPLQSEPTWDRLFGEINSFLRPQASPRAIHLVAKQ